MTISLDEVSSQEPLLLIGNPFEFFVNPNATTLGITKGTLSK